MEDLKDAWLRPVTIDSIHFKAPSKVGDRVHVTAGVTRVFDFSLEVFVRVTSAAVDKQDIWTHCTHRSVRMEEPGGGPGGSGHD